MDYSIQGEGDIYIRDNYITTLPYNLTITQDKEDDPESIKGTMEVSDQEVMFWQGVRVGELFNLRLDDGNKLYIHCKKSAQGNMVEVTGENDNSI